MTPSSYILVEHIIQEFLRSNYFSEVLLEIHRSHPKENNIFATILKKVIITSLNDL